MKQFPFDQFQLYNKLLFYDPYRASIDWEAVTPFLNCWGEVILNHMVSDTVRGAALAIEESKIKRYEETYEKDIEEILKLGNDRKALDQILVDVMRNQMVQPNSTYIASFPFYNRNNGLVYNLIFCSHNIAGFKLFKSVAWKTFGGRSSAKTTKNVEGQLSFDLNNTANPSSLVSTADETCYCISDIAEYLYNQCRGKGEISLDELWKNLDVHPIFPSDGYRNEIKAILAENHNVTKGRKSLIFH